MGLRNEQLLRWQGAGDHPKERSMLIETWQVHTNLFQAARNHGRLIMAKRHFKDSEAILTRNRVKYSSVELNHKKVRNLFLKQFPMCSNNEQRKSLRARNQRLLVGHRVSIFSSDHRGVIISADWNLTNGDRCDVECDNGEEICGLKRNAINFDRIVGLDVNSSRTDGTVPKKKKK